MSVFVRQEICRTAVHRHRLRRLALWLHYDLRNFCILYWNELLYDKCVLFVAFCDFLMWPLVAVCVCECGKKVMVVMLMGPVQ